MATMPNKSRKVRRNQKGNKKSVPDKEKNLSKKQSKRALVSSKISDEMKAHIDAQDKLNDPVPVFFKLENLPVFDEIRDDFGGDIVAAARKLGVDRILGGNARVLVMWNTLPTSKIDKTRYHIHHHVTLRHYDANGEPLLKDSLSPKLLEKINAKEREVQVQQLKEDAIKAELMKCSSKKKRPVLQKQFEAAEDVRGVLQAQLDKLNKQADEKESYAPNCHLKYALGSGGHAGECPALNKYAIRKALAFKNDALRDPERLKCAFHVRPDQKKYKGVKGVDFERGKELVVYEECKAERQHFGFKLFMRKGNADHEAGDDDEGEEKKQKTDDEATVVYEHEKVDRKPHPFPRQELTELARTKSQVRAVTHYLSRSKSRPWKPYRERAMDTD